MIYLLISFFILLVALGLGVLMAQDPGYVLVLYQHWSMETSLWAILVALLILFIVFYILCRFLSRIIHIPRAWRRFWKRRAEMKALRRCQMDTENKRESKKKYYEHQLELANLEGPSALWRAWHQLPRALRHDMTMIEKFVYALIKHGENDQALALIADTLKKQWHDKLAILYAYAQGSQPAKQLWVAESFRKHYPQEAIASFCAGYLNLRQGFLQNAEDYLKESMRLSPSSHAYEALGCIYEQRNDMRSALNCFHKGLEYVNKKTD